MHHHVLVARLLDEALRMQAVALLLHVAEIGRLQLGLPTALLVGGQKDVVFADAAGDVSAAMQGDGLAHGEFAQQLVEILCRHLRFGSSVQQFIVQQVEQGRRGQFAHTIDNHVGPAVAEYRGAQPFLPIVVVGHAAQRSLDAAQHNGHIGEELFENLRIDDGGIFGPHIVASVGAVGIFGAQAAVGRIFIDHRIHHARRNAEEHTRTAQLAKVAEVAVPVGLRNDGHAVAFGLNQAADDGSAKGRMVHVGIAREQDNVYFVPTAELHLLAGGG